MHFNYFIREWNPTAGTDLSCPRQPPVRSHGHDKSVPAELLDSQIYLFISISFCENDRSLTQLPETTKISLSGACNFHSFLVYCLHEQAIW
jgi:hypothetical protein